MTARKIVERCTRYNACFGQISACIAVHLAMPEWIAVPVQLPLSAPVQLPLNDYSAHRRDALHDRKRNECGVSVEASGGK